MTLEVVVVTLLEDWTSPLEVVMVTLLEDWTSLKK